MSRIQRFSVAAGLLAALCASAGDAFDRDWRFLRADEPHALSPTFDDARWDTVTLPHTARVEALVAGKENPQWQGICWYRKTFELPADAGDRILLLNFDGAMNVAEVWVNGESAGRFMGGYLPCVMDISSLAQPGRTNVIAVRLDNRDNPITGPKPLADLDFNLYGGLYRGAHLIIKDPLHITDPNLADKVASGGVFVTFPSVSAEQATVAVRTHIQNSGESLRSFTLRTTLLDPAGNAVVMRESKPAGLAAAADREVIQEIQFAHPKLWSPNSPHLYQVRSELIEQGRTVDAEQTRVGIRRIEITRDGFRINGDKMFLRGANRHQEYPYLGNALSDDAQYRDAQKIKEAGFDYVRLSHYPQSPAFLDACDELGLVVMNCLMGWQYFGTNAAFAELKLNECRQLVRRDRNHPCVILWEVSLNESDMPNAFIAKTHAIAHEEYPGDQCFTCGWTKGYDVFIQARQHGGCRKIEDQPCVVSEYGDWEYYAQNAGLEQHQWKDLQPAERSSRQLRGDGESRLLQQALNFQEAHNDNLETHAFADGIWVMFDYNRGYAPDIESSGVMDIFRLPKPAYWFFRTQRDPDDVVAGHPAGPMVYIANDWAASPKAGSNTVVPSASPKAGSDTAVSNRVVRVFSNCEEVALQLNGRMVERRRPDASRVSTRLRHPPFTFDLERFEPGTLRAIAYIGARPVAQHERRTPRTITGMTLRLDTGGRVFAATGKDAVFCHADLQDEDGTVHPTARAAVSFGLTGGAQLIGHNPILSEAGTATILLASDAMNPVCTVFALCLVQEEEQTRVLSAGLAAGGQRDGSSDSAAPKDDPVPACVIHYTTDGSEPSARSPVYLKPVGDAPKLRAALVANGRVVATADSRAPVASTAAATFTVMKVAGH